jgi:hypothetical protein
MLTVFQMAIAIEDDRLTVDFPMPIQEDFAQALLVPGNQGPVKRHVILKEVLRLIGRDRHSLQAKLIPPSEGTDGYRGLGS